MPQSDKSPQNNNEHPEDMDLEHTPFDIENILNSHNQENGDQGNEYLHQLLNQEESFPELNDTPLGKAQALAYAAMNAPTRKECINLARQALKMSPDCADAYIILAEEYATSAGEALHYYRAGVAAAERAIGERLFKDLIGVFWSDLRTRPYMRARAGLAECLWEMGKQKESVDHYQDMLRLDPKDSLGIRYVLAGCYLRMDNREALKKLLARYAENSAVWLYTRALLLFIEEGDSPEARKALRVAERHNHYVIPYISGLKKLPRQVPEFIGLGDKKEAIYYAAEFGDGWMDTPGATEWLKKMCYREPSKAPSQKNLKGIPKVFLQAFRSQDEAGSASQEEGKIYTFKVGLKYAPGVWRKIDIKGSQTLHHLHTAITRAFGREDNHLYAFFMNNKAWDPSSEYGPPYGETGTANAKKTRIDSLGLKSRARFLYIFDFGDEWQHNIILLSTREESSPGRYPKIIESHGEAPPQYRGL